MAFDPFEIQREVLEAFSEATQRGRARRFLPIDGFVIRNHPGGAMRPVRVACTEGHGPELGRRRRDGYFYCIGCERAARSRREAVAPPLPRVFGARSCDVCGCVFVPAASDRRRTCSDGCRKRLTSSSRKLGRAPMIAAARALRRQGASLRVIALQLGSSPAAVWRMLR